MNANAQTFRVVKLKLLSPHFFYDPLFFDCSDVTNDAPSIGRSVNQNINTSLFEDADGDLLSDFSIVLNITKEEISLSQTHCTFSEPIRCEDDSDAIVFSRENSAATCFDPTILNKDLVPKARAVFGPCTKTDSQNLEFDLVGSTLEFSDSRLFIRQMNGDTLSGTLHAFISEKSAAATDISGDPLSLFLRGSSTVCAPGDDREYNDAGSKGWWFVFEFDARPAELFVNEGCGCDSTNSPVSFFALVIFLLFIFCGRRATVSTD